jgi:hypothetical protein
MTPISRRGYVQNPANRLNTKTALVLIDEGPRYCKRRSSSAWAKKALASFNTSLARLSSRTSRSSSMTRGALAAHLRPGLQHHRLVHEPFSLGSVSFDQVCGFFRLLRWRWQANWCFWLSAVQIGTKQNYTLTRTQFASLHYMESCNRTVASDFI